MSTSGGREELVQRLQAALTALEGDDEETFRKEIGAIAQLRASPVMLALARLARELGETLGSLNVADPLFAELPDACARLEHVVKMTEDATHKTWTWSSVREKCWRHCPQMLHPMPWARCAGICLRLPWPRPIRTSPVKSSNGWSVLSDGFTTRSPRLASTSPPSDKTPTWLARRSRA